MVLIVIGAFIAGTWFGVFVMSAFNMVSRENERRDDLQKEENK